MHANVHSGSGVAIIYGSALTESFRNGEATLCWPFPDDYNPPKTKEAAN
jgi:hypothetical protein